MKQIFRIFAAVAVMAAVAGCYNDFDTPQPAKVVTDEDFKEMTRMTIQQVKELFYAEHGDVSDTGGNTSWLVTKDVQEPEDKGFNFKGKTEATRTLADK